MFGQRTNREGSTLMTTTPLGRRRLLQTAGLAASGTVTGFPTVWAQNIKDVSLRQFGTGVSNLNAIADKVKQDLGFTPHASPHSGLAISD
jgi:putative spermidine/putrescine transport system substrate-binding protein